MRTSFTEIIQANGCCISLLGRLQPRVYWWILSDHRICLALAPFPQPHELLELETERRLPIFNLKADHSAKLTGVVDDEDSFHSIASSTTSDGFLDSIFQNVTTK